MEDITALEQQVEQLVAEGQKSEAVAVLYKAIVACVETRKFLDAERLHARMAAIDPIALTEIINAAEIIDSAKGRGIDTAHKEVWGKFYSLMSEEERNALYYSMQRMSIDPGKEIIRQGSLNNRLYFVDRGHLKVMVRRGARENFLMTLGPGDIFGYDTFFTISISTVSIETDSPVVLNAVERKEFERLEESYPGIETKIEEYCRKNEQKKLDAIFRKKDLDRRTQKRHKVDGRVKAQIVDREGKPVGGSFKGQVDDISAGGASFLIRCSKKSTARTLLGRQGIFEFSFGREGRGFEMTAKAVIISVGFLLFNDYCVHLRFGKPLTDTDINYILASTDS